MDRPSSSGLSNGQHVRLPAPPPVGALENMPYVENYVYNIYGEPVEFRNLPDTTAGLAEFELEALFEGIMMQQRPTSPTAEYRRNVVPGFGRRAEVGNIGDLRLMRGPNSSIPAPPNPAPVDVVPIVPPSAGALPFAHLLDPASVVMPQEVARLTYEITSLLAIPIRFLPDDVINMRDELYELSSRLHEPAVQDAAHRLIHLIRMHDLQHPGSQQPLLSRVIPPPRLSSRRHSQSSSTHGSLHRNTTTGPSSSETVSSTSTSQPSPQPETSAEPTSSTRPVVDEPSSNRSDGDQPGTSRAVQEELAPKPERVIKRAVRRRPQNLPPIHLEPTIDPDSGFDMLHSSPISSLHAMPIRPPNRSQPAITTTQIIDFEEILSPPPHEAMRKQFTDFGIDDEPQRAEFRLLDPPECAAKNLLLDAELLRRDPPKLMTCGPTDDNILEWSAVINLTDASESPYAGGIFFLELKFNNDYPDKMPFVAFLTRIWHPWVLNDGSLSFPREVLIRPEANKLRSFLSLMVDMLMDVPDDDNPDSTAAKFPVENAEQYTAEELKIKRREKARHFAQRYAK